MNNAQRESIAIDCELKINAILVDALIAQSPNPQALLRKLQRDIDEMTAAAPSGTDPEHVVELRARAEQRALSIRKQMPSSA